MYKQNNACVDHCCLTPQFYDSRDNFFEMTDVFSALSYINSSPECQNSIYKLILRLWFYFSSLLAKKSWIYLDTCLGSWSCINLWVPASGKVVWRYGTNVSQIISTYSSLFMIPSKMQMGVGLCMLIPAHTWPFVGRLALHGSKKQHRTS